MGSVHWSIEYAHARVLYEPRMALLCIRHHYIRETSEYGVQQCSLIVSLNMFKPSLRLPVFDIILSLPIKTKDVLMNLNGFNYSRFTYLMYEIKLCSDMKFYLSIYLLNVNIYMYIVIFFDHAHDQTYVVSHRRCK